MKLYDFIQRKSNLFLFILIVFVSATSLFLPFTTSPKTGERIFNSPDEMSNFYFSKLYAQKSVFHSPLPLNREYGNGIHPRAVTTGEDGSLLPGSFLGLIFLYGMLAKIFGVGSIVYLTPVISVFGTYAYYKLLREFFNNSIAYSSALLLLVFPAWWYYNSRSMFHNVLYINLLIFALLFLVRNLKYETLIDLSISFLFVILAVFVRTSEALWVLPGFFGILIAKYWKRNISTILLLSVFSLASLAGIAALHNAVFGNSLTGAYTLSGTSRNALQLFFNYIFPFGVHPVRAAMNFFRYYILLFWWFAVPCISGMIFFIAFEKNASRFVRYYTVLAGILLVYLLVYYGSWNIVDNLDPKKITLGTSYTRYWLPFYLSLIPYGVYAWQKVGSFLSRWSFSLLSASLLITFYILSYSLVWRGTEESIFSVSKTIHGYYEKRERVAELVPRNAVIVSERSDKIFFPKFHVIVPGGRTETYGIVSKMVREGIPVYLYSHLQKKDIQSLEEMLGGLGISLVEKKHILENEFLYTMKAIEYGR